MTNEPRNVKDLLVDMKDTSELMVDLAYSAITYGNEEIAEEVLALEDHMNTLQQEAHKSLMLASRSPEDAERLLGVFHIVSAAEKIADAADDIATLVTADTSVPRSLQSALIQSQEITVRITLPEDTGQETVEAFESDAGAGTQILSVRRGGTWLFDPSDATILEPSDIVFLRGPKDVVKTVYDRLTGDAFPTMNVEETDQEHAGLVTGLTDMKDIMELAIGLGYSAALFNNRELAEEVLSLESNMDRMKEHVHTSILEAAQTADDVTPLRSLSDIASASEIISDAALEIAAAVIRDIEPHPVLLEAIQESDEIITQLTVEPGSKLDGEQLTALDIDSGLGMTVMAIRRGGNWQYNPDPQTVLESGDLVIVRGPANNETQVQDLSAA